MNPSPNPDPSLLWNRRELLQATGLGLLGLAMGEVPGVSSALAAEAGKAPAAPALAPLNRFSRMVQEQYVGRVRRLDQSFRAKRMEMKNLEDAQRYVLSVRQKIQTCFGPWPEKTPLNARTTKTIERDAYTIENVIFESRPGFLVTANLYIPKGKQFPLPGIVGSCGHSTNGKAAEAYQSFAQGLARQGYVVLIFDPIGQGERFQYTNEQLKSPVGAGVQEHLLGGNQQFLVGEFFGSWRAWDGIRALDYLLTRKEVNPQIVGITGNSGGGTMTTWLCGLESRWTMAAPACFVTTFRRNLENELPADTEQCPPKALALGLDHEDFIAAMAPRPVILLAKERDFFDVRGTEEAYGRLQRLYDLLGYPNNIAMFTGPTYHGYSQENREEMYKFFNAMTQVSTAEKEPALEIEKDEALWCTPNGQVAELKSRTMFSFTKEISEKLRKERAPLDGNALRQALTNVLKVRRQSTYPDYRILRPLGNRKYPTKHAITYVVETEPGIQTLVTRLTDEPLYSRPPKDKKRAVLYISHHSADAELREEPLIKEIIGAEKDAAIYACDVRGIGESQPDTCGANSFLTPYGSDYFYAIHAIMLDDSYVAQKTWDILRTIDWLRGTGHEGVHLVAKGWGTIPATFAAIIADEVNQVTFKNALTSFADLAETEIYKWPLSCMVPGVLKSFDLPDCYRMLSGKKLKMIETWNGKGEVVA
ncbi:MAG: Alpha/beta hydrolase family protein [Verrucomicrobia bacterium]|nr:Alpha/beta hydrolase family protein [Verrucomicrobiota bacterium]